jgi:hypothetical protein
MVYFSYWSSYATDTTKNRYFWRRLLKMTDTKIENPFFVSVEIIAHRYCEI